MEKHSKTKNNQKKNITKEECSSILMQLGMQQGTCTLILCIIDLKIKQSTTKGAMLMLYLDLNSQPFDY